MPGVFNLSVDEAVKEARETALWAFPVMLFGLPETKDEVATGAWADNGIVQQAARAIKREVPDLIVMGDVCLCEYMSHGHCGMVSSRAGRSPGRCGRNCRHAMAGRLRNRQRCHARAAGPDGGFPGTRRSRHHRPLRHDGWPRSRHPQSPRPGRVREYPDLVLAAKFASGYYGPFRERLIPPQFGDRRSYQMDGANLREAMREIELDIEEGADMIMVKPAFPYLDVIAAARALRLALGGLPGFR